ncbi:MAG: hypothetical protein ACTSQA_00350 [Candidatus Heimdallarchaeaceae archaeon]
MKQTNKQDKWFSWLALILWAIFFWPGAVIYMIIKAVNKKTL